MRRIARTLHRDDGFAAGGEMLAFGVLVFIVGSLMILSAWQVVDAKFAAASAAREATRAYVESTDASEARRRATAVALEALKSHGLSTAHLREVSLEGTLERCARVRTEVRYRVPALVLPWIDGIGSVDVRADHSEIVDPLRSGIAGEATCLG